MPLDPNVCYRALRARDERFDGEFFVCVKSTGIYCRPICPARPVRAENCVFVPTAAAAQEAGYRACLRCRPDTSPDSPAWHGTSSSVSRALHLIDDGILDTQSIEYLAERLGMGARHLRRLFEIHIGASPLTVAQTRRILLAKQLIHDTNLPMTRIAEAAGFASLRRFNEVFRDQFGRPPSQLRRRTVTSLSANAALSVLLPYRAPYDWAAMLSFLESRAIPGVEAVRENAYWRTIQIGNQTGFVAVSHVPGNRALRASIHINDFSLVPQIIARLKRLFDVGANPAAIGQVLERDVRLAPMVRKRPGLRVPGAWDQFELSVRAIVGQQISVKAASLLAGSLASTYGSQIETGVDGLTHVFPSPALLAQLLAAGSRMPRARTQTIATLASAATKDPNLYDAGRDLDSAIERLTALQGIGDWTAQYIAMRALRHTDAFPPGDAALMRFADQGGKLSANQLQKRAEAWRPWRAYAVLHLWTAETDTRNDAAAA